MLHALLGIRSLPQLLVPPLSGASWEGFALEQVLRIAQPDEAYFWATHQGAELDLLLARMAAHEAPTPITAMDPKRL